MARPLNRWQRGAVARGMLPAGPFTVWTLDNMIAGRDAFGRVLTKANIRPALSFTRNVAQSKYGSAEGLTGSPSSPSLSMKTGIQGPNKWSALLIFTPGALGGDSFMLGWKDTPGSGLADRSIYVQAGGTAYAYVYDGSGKFLAAGTATEGINVMAVRCDGSTLYARLNDGAEQSLAVSNGGYAAFNVSTVVMEAFVGQIGGSSKSTTVTLHFMAFYTRCLSYGEALGFNQNPWRVFAERPSMERSLLGSNSAPAPRRRQIVN